MVFAEEQVRVITVRRVAKALGNLLKVRPQLCLPTRREDVAGDAGGLDLIMGFTLESVRLRTTMETMFDVNSSCRSIPCNTTWMAYRPGRGSI